MCAMDPIMKKILDGIAESKAAVGTYRALEAKLKAIAIARDSAPLDRRKLARLGEQQDQTTPITLSELVTLDGLFAREGGLAGLLRLPHVLDAFVERGKVRFLI